MWVLEPIKPEKSLEAKLTKQELSYFQAHHNKVGCFGKDKNAGKMEDGKQRESLNMR